MAVCIRYMPWRWALPYSREECMWSAIKLDALDAIWKGARICRQTEPWHSSCNGAASSINIFEIAKFHNGPVWPRIKEPCFDGEPSGSQIHCCCYTNSVQSAIFEIATRNARRPDALFAYSLALSLSLSVYISSPFLFFESYCSCCRRATGTFRSNSAMFFCS